MNHASPHPRAGQTVTVKPAAPLYGHTDANPVEYVIEDWNDRVFGRSWMLMDGHPASLGYALRSVSGELPLDNEVVYGKAGPFGHLVHISEIEGSDAR